MDETKSGVHDSTDVVSRSISRRKAIKTAVAAGAAVYSLPLIDTVAGVDLAHADTSRPGGLGTCNPGDNVCGGPCCANCNGTIGNPGCFCITTPEGVTVCAQFTGQPCGSYQPCTKSTDCPPGQFCTMPSSNCCGPNQGICVAPCSVQIHHQATRVTAQPGVVIPPYAAL